MAFDHGRKLLIRLEPLPLQARPPVLEEAPCPSFALIVPKLAETLLEQIGAVEPLVGGEQGLQCLLAVEREVLPPLQQGVFLAFDIASVAARKPRIFALADGIERLAEMTHHMELDATFSLPCAGPTPGGDLAQPNNIHQCADRASPRPETNR